MRRRSITLQCAVLCCWPSMPGVCIAGNEGGKPVPEAHRAWIEQREASLRDPDGYLGLSGLFWLKDGAPEVGSAEDNDIVFPNKRGPKRVGRLIVQGDRVNFIAAPEATVLHAGEPVKRLRLLSDADGEPTKLRAGPLTFWLIERYGMLAIRLRDPLSPVLKNYAGTPRFPYSSDWRVEAKYEPAKGSAAIRVPSVLGKSSDEAVTAKVRFTLGSDTYTLHATGESNGEAFIILGDETNGKETYHGGRFLRVPTPEQGERTIIDFNRAYNPPCAYSRCTTCPLVPAENKLPLPIQAGEMMPKQRQ